MSAQITNTRVGEWTLKEGHSVIYTSHSYYYFYAGQTSRWTKTFYACSCGEKNEVSGPARRAHLASHDEWSKPSALSAILKLLAEESN